jgi:hypothetical protein
VATAAANRLSIKRNLPHVQPHIAGEVLLRAAAPKNKFSKCKIDKKA